MIEGSNAKAIRVPTTKAVTKPAISDHFLRMTTHKARIGHKKENMWGLANGINNAAPARNGRSSSRRKKSMMPINRINPSCPATRHAGTGANKYPAIRKTDGGSPPLPYMRQAMRMDVTWHTSKIASQVTQAQ